MATLGNYIPFLGLVLLGVLAQCGTKDITKSFDATQANRLLSTDTSKTWFLIARTEDNKEVFNTCIEDNTLTFVNATIDSLYVLGREVSCGNATEADTLYKAQYTLGVNDNGVFQQIINLKEEKYQTIGSIQIENMTSSRLKLNYTVDGKSIQESYIY